MSMTTAQYLALVEQIGYPEGKIKDVIVARIKANDPGTKFTVYGTALRKGLITKEGQGARYAAWLKASGQTA